MTSLAISLGIGFEPEGVGEGEEAGDAGTELDRKMSKSAARARALARTVRLALSRAIRGENE